MLLIKEVSGTKAQMSHWKQLYEEIKESLTEKVELSMVSRDKKDEGEKMVDEVSIICKECEMRKLTQEFLKEV